MKNQIYITAALLTAFLVTGCGGSAVDAVARDPIMAITESDAVVEGIDLSESLDQEGAVTQIAANKTKTVTLYGTNLQLGLKVTFNGAACLTHDLAAYDNQNEDSGQTELSADCPGQAIGTYALKVTDPDSGKEVFSQNIEVVDGATLTNLRQIRLANIRPSYGSVLTGRAASVNPVASRRQALQLTLGGAGTVSGTVKWQRPRLPAGSYTSAALDYSAVDEKVARGLVVKLLDADNNDAVLGTTATDANGQYEFTGVPANRNLKVQVVAQIAQTRATGATTGAQYNFMMRDNTAVGATKPLYSKTTTAFAASGGVDTKDLTALLGFDNAGNVTGTRESAPFAILDVIYNAVAGIQAADPNVTLSDLNIYWSLNNRPGDGDKSQGLIGTSHFSDQGDYPGVFILGKADVDTDEFDRGVIGHEFGHYLQTVASYSDNPGGAHSANEFKDASLAYGEGFGTAIGGLLSGSSYYADSSGVKQGANVPVQDLTQTPPAGEANGFYAENSVAYLLYKLGSTYGFTPFWKATTSLKTGHESATVFNFLDKFIAASNGNPSSDTVLGLASPVNIKTVNPLGVLGSNVQADSSINSTVSGGATDLERIYSELTPQAPSGTDAQQLTASNGVFCLNKKLKGANTDTNSNGLGWTRRFTFTSNFTGTAGIKIFNADKLAFPDGTVMFKIRESENGKSVAVYNWDDGAGRWSVKNGVKYSIVIQVLEPKIFTTTGNTCGNNVYLWQATALPTI
jgi:hypothetical protein